MKQLFSKLLVAFLLTSAVVLSWSEYFSFLEKLVLLTNRGLCKRGCYKINLINFSLLAIANPKSFSLPTLKLLRFRNKGSKVGAGTIPLKLYELPLLLHSLKRKEIVALLLWECLTTFLQPSWDF